MSKEIVEKKFNGTLNVLNKEIDIHNEVFKGACFQIKIPKAEKLDI